MKYIINLCVIVCLLSFDLHADNREFVDMGVRADNGDILYWSTGDILLLENGRAKIADYGEMGSLVGWGDITGRVIGEDLNKYGGSNPLKEISGNNNYDIARAKLGQPYRLPTFTELSRLHKNCSMEFVRIPRILKGRSENGAPLWLQGQWMWQHVIHTSRGSFGGWLSVKIDGLLVNVLSSEGHVLYEGAYSYSNGVLKFSDFTLYLDMEKELIKDDKGEYFKKVSNQSTLTEICGYMLTSKINGNQLFFPAPPSYTAISTGGAVIVGHNSQNLKYWSATLWEKDYKRALSLVFASDGWGIVAESRDSHLRIRAVKSGSESANLSQSTSTTVEKSKVKVPFNEKKSSNVISPRTNSKGQYMVKTATWKTYGSGDGSYRMDLEYSPSNELSKITKRYVIGKNKVTETLTLKNDNGKYLKFIRFVNGKQNFSAKAMYNFNEDGVISHINWYAPSKNKLVQTFQMFYDEDKQLVKMIQKTSENMDRDWSSETITQINWENGNIVSDREIRNNDTESYTGQDFVYYPESQIRNNTNLNFHNLIMYSYIRDYTSDIVMGTEWCGKNTYLILKGDKRGLRRYGHLEPKYREHYEYETNGELITTLRYIAPRVGVKPYIFGTLTLEYLY